MRAFIVAMEYGGETLRTGERAPRVTYDGVLSIFHRRGLPWRWHAVYRGAGTRRSGGSSADVEVELDRKVGLAERLPGMGNSFGFYAMVQCVQVG